MKYPVYSYRDAKVGFGQPIVDSNDLSAKRGFAYAINNSVGVMGFQPGDFDLYHIGTFDSETGMITGQTPGILATGLSVFNMNKTDDFDAKVFD